MSASGNDGAIIAPISDLVTAPHDATSFTARGVSVAPGINSKLLASLRRSPPEAREKLGDRRERSRSRGVGRKDRSRDRAISASSAAAAVAAAAAAASGAAATTTTTTATSSSRSSGSGNHHSHKETRRQLKKEVCVCVNVYVGVGVNIELWVRFVLGGGRGGTVCAVGTVMFSCSAFRIPRAYGFSKIGWCFLYTPTGTINNSSTNRVQSATICFNIIR